MANCTCVEVLGTIVLSVNPLNTAHFAANQELSEFLRGDVQGLIDRTCRSRLSSRVRVHDCRWHLLIHSV